MATEKLDTEIRREQIATAALGMMAQHGLADLNIAGLARRVGLVPSGIMRHYRSKDEIIDAAVDHIRDSLLKNVKAALDEKNDPFEQLESLLMMHVRLIRENRGILHIVLSQDVYSGHPERRARIFKMIHGYLEKVAQLIRRGQQMKRIRPDVDADTISVMFLGLIQPAAILWHMSEGQFDATRHAQRAWKIFRVAIEMKR